MCNLFVSEIHGRWELVRSMSRYNLYKIAETVISQRQIFRGRLDRRLCAIDGFRRWVIGTVHVYEVVEISELLIESEDEKPGWQVPGPTRAPCMAH